ncbi:MAG: pyrroline-5-carboxylate reductase [Gammaproteobacteria bacterium]|nr:pyrroline-5-carboxylate reductase [Gammaproteobacteria bacterium]
MHEYKVGFIGGGNMAQAIATGLIGSGTDAGDILISEPNAEQRARLTEELRGAAIAIDNDAVAAAAETIVLAVKPQIMRAVCHDLRKSVQRHRPLVLTIAAGIRSAAIDRWLGGDLPIVRVMPNQPALLRRGVSGLYANDKTSGVERARAMSIMSAVGKVVGVDAEDDIDVVTAISGSGPAYFYFLIDVLQATGQRLGLPPETARTLAVETAVGSSALAAESDEAMQNLIARVRSPGGTTAAALDSLDNENVRAIFARAITAAQDRAVVLADEAEAEPDTKDNS